MSASTISRIIVRIPSRSTTGNDAARPEGAPALHVRLQAASKHSVSAAHSKPLTQSGARNRMTLAPQRLLPRRHVPTKSP